MLARFSSLVLVVAVAACGGRAPAPLAFGLPSVGSVSYGYADTTAINVSAMGQNMSIGINTGARYATSFARGSSGTEVTMRVDELSSTMQVPMGGVETATEDDVSGSLVFTLDRRGHATVIRSPEVSALASRAISGLTTAHTFFPRLPDRVVAPGERWVDTVSFEGDSELGPYAETSVFEYVVVGDTVVAGTPLMSISVTGTTEVTATFDMGGMRVAQESALDVVGHVLWDSERGLVSEYVRHATGSGRARVPVAPVPLPLELEVVQRAYLIGG